jgi:hypothetical protein
MLRRRGGGVGGGDEFKGLRGSGLVKMGSVCLVELDYCYIPRR